MLSLSIAKKDIVLLLRDPVGLFWTVVFPLLFSLFLGGVLHTGFEGRAAQKRILVVQAEQGPAARRLLSELSQEPSVSLEDSTLDAARLETKRGRAFAYLEFAQDQGNQPFYRIAIDPMRRSQLGELEGALNAARARMMNVEGAPMSRSQNLHEHPPTSADMVLPLALVWALIGVSASFAISLVSERSRGTLLRLRCAPTSLLHVVLGKALASGLVSLVVGTALVVLAVVVFGARVDSALAFASALVTSAIAFSGLTVLLSVLGRTEQAVGGAGWATLVLMAMVGGAMVPTSLMPSWLQKVSELSPVRWATYALEVTSWRQLAWQDALPSILSLLALGIICFAIGFVFLAKQSARD